jgi:hypothetical protein
MLKRSLQAGARGYALGLPTTKLIKSKPAEQQAKDLIQAILNKSGIELTTILSQNTQHYTDPWKSNEKAQTTILKTTE